jgi:hypothetical protein
LLEKSLGVGKSKTAGGEGRIVFFSDTAARTLAGVCSKFPDAVPAHNVFPSER